jgi:hypothetical protein
MFVFGFEVRVSRRTSAEEDLALESAVQLVVSLLAEVDWLSSL